MLSRLFSRSRTPAKRPAQKSPPFRLGLEALEAREVPATLIALNANNALLRFDSATPGTVTATTPISGLDNVGERVVGIDFRPRTGQLYALSVDMNGGGTSARLYTLNPLTGGATRVGAGAITITADAFGQYGFDFNPTVDRIRVTNASDENFRINPVTGGRADLLPNDFDINPAGNSIDGVAYDRNFDAVLGTNGTTLYALNSGAGLLQTIGGVNGMPSPNIGTLSTTVGPLGVTIDTSIFAGVGFDIATTAAGQQEAFAVLDSDAGLPVTYALYRINLTNGAATLVGQIGSGVGGLIGLAIVPASAVVVGSGLGAGGDVRLLDSTTGAVRTRIVPFGNYNGGLRVAAGDITRDGVPDVIVSATIPGGHVKTFDGVSGTQVNGLIGSFIPFIGFTGTVNVGSGDVNGDGFADVLVVANNASGHVKAFSGVDGSELASFFAYAGFNGNVTVSGADFNNDGFDEIVTGAAINGHVKVFAATGAGNGSLFTAATLPNFIPSFLAYQGFTTGPVAVAAGDVNGDGIADIVAIAGTGSRGHVKAFSGRDGSSLASFFAYPATLTTAPSIGLADANGDGVADIRVTPGANQDADVRTFDLNGLPLAGVSTFPAFANFVGGATIGGARV